jgi:Carboxypeptidase regulatory-like domain
MRSLARCLTHIFYKWNPANLAIAIALVFALSSTIALAQSGAGSIQGTVTDSTGAVLPGASIHVVTEGTSIAADTKSNGVGFYQVPGLFTGTYVVTITAPNMKSYRTTVELQVAQAAVVNATMTAGAVTQQVEVAANVVQLTTSDNGTIAATLESSRLNQLPMNGRILLTLAGEATPGLESTGQRANGLMPEALEYVADGVPLSNRNFGGEGNSTQAQLPDPDSVQEVRIETTNTSAMYSAPATGIITTKSGTNSLHGSFFETARNNAIGIAKARQNAANYAAPPLVRNEFGASAGGPIILPHVYNGKDKSFWFFAYERYSLAQQAAELVSVPTAAMRGGDFSQLKNGSNVLQALYDPSTTYNSGSANCPGTPTSATNPNGANPACRSQFDYNGTPNVINPALLAPATKTMYAITPLPNIAGVTDPLQGPDINFADDTYVVIPTITFRLDHSFNENNKAYLRYTSNNQINQALRNYPANSPDTIAADGFPNGASGYQDITIASFGSALGYTHVFSPDFFSETIVSQDWFIQYVGGGGNPKLDYENMLGLPNNFGETGFPVIGSNLIMPYGGTQYQYQENQIISNIDENLTKTIGKHQMQFGGRYRHERFGYLPDRSADTVTFGAGETTGLLDPSTVASKGDSALPNTGYQDGDFFLGGAASYSVTQEPPYIHFHDMEFDGYFQDNWHVSRNLTLNLGLRYEAHPAPWMKYGLTESFDLKNDAIVLPNPLSYYIAHNYTTQTIITNLQNIGVAFETPSEAGFPSVGFKNDDLTVGPRVGFAYQPFGGKFGTVIRGAYGRYIYPVPVRNFEKPIVSNQPFVAGYSQSYTAANQSPDSLPNYLLRYPQSVVMGKNSTGVVNSSGINSIIPGFSLGTVDPDVDPDFVTQTNFTIEQPLKGNSALRITWLWSHGTNLDHYYNYNNHPSQYIWELNTGTALPNGGASVIGTPQQNTYAATATGPYNQTTYGGNFMITKDGWSNDNALQVNYQRLFHRGVAYQISYVWSKPFRVGGNTFRDGQIDTAEDNYPLNSLGTVSSPYGTFTPGALPPARPAGIAPYAEWHQLEVFEQYGVDSAIPKQHIQFNGIVDLPFGRGKRFLGNSNRFMDEVVGGWQIAGDGSIASQDFGITSSNYGPTNPLKIYKHGAKITDCRSGTCHPSYLWFNGYIAPTANANTGCTSKCVSGLPSNYAPYETPIDNTPGTTYYGQNEVNVTLLNGQVVPNTFSPGPFGANPFSHTFLNGPINWTIDTSLFKVFPITEKVNLRFNLDAFNALNVQGYNNPNGTDGTEAVADQVASSYNTPRQLQFTLRLTF